MNKSLINSAQMQANRTVVVL